MTSALFDSIASLVDRIGAVQRSVSPETTMALPDLPKMLTAANSLGAVASLVWQDPEWSPTSPLSRMARHDLLNGLNQIIGYGEMLGEEALDRDFVAIEAAVRDMVAEAKNIATAVERSARRAAGDTPEARLASGDDLPAASWSTSHRPFQTANPVLVVDDSELNRDVLSSFLRRNGLTVVEAPDGLAALAALERQPIDLVLLDVIMPRLDGYGVLERMHATPGLTDIPVLMVSGLSEIESVVRCIEKGAADYLPKPFNPVLLRARIGACLEKKAALDRERETLQALKDSQERLAGELAEAERYVRSMLPPPLAGAISIDWRFLPSTHLGGDALGHHWIDPDHLALFVLDVCGHGVGAALQSVSVAHVLRSFALLDTDFRDPAQVLMGLNETFPMEQHNNQYFTIWYGVYNRISRRLRYSSGGHPPALLVEKSAGGIVTRHFGHAGLIVGAMPGVTYTSAETAIAPGARLYLFSDGAYEITRQSGEMLLVEEFESLIVGLADEGHHLLDALIVLLREVRGSVDFEDDVSVMEVTFG